MNTVCNPEVFDEPITHEREELDMPDPATLPDVEELTRERVPERERELVPA